MLSCTLLSSRILPRLVQDEVSKRHRAWMLKDASQNDPSQFVDPRLDQQLAVGLGPTQQQVVRKRVVLVTGYKAQASHCLAA